MTGFFERILEATPKSIRPPAEVVLRTIHGVGEDRVPGLAAEIAFYTVLSLPALLLSILATVGFVGDQVNQNWRDSLAAEVQGMIGTLLSPDGQEVMNEFVVSMVNESRGGIIGFGFIVAVYSASRAMRVVRTALVIAYDQAERRPAWTDRVWGLVLTLVGLIVIVGLTPLVIAGPDGGAAASTMLGGVPALEEVWRVLYWPAAGAVLTLLIAALFHVAVPWRTKFRRELPGALLAMVLWLLTSAGLRLYIGNTVDSFHGVMAVPLVVLLWVWISALMLLLGAELNAAIEHVWPSVDWSDPEVFDQPPAEPTEVE